MYLKTFTFTLSAIFAFARSAPQQYPAYSYAQQQSPNPYAQQQSPNPYGLQTYAAPATETYFDQNPAHYKFQYDVSDPVTGDQHSQQESRDNDVVQGFYSLVEPDGSVRVVNYHASDAEGFVADVQKTPAGSAPGVNVKASPPSRPQPSSYRANAAAYNDLSPSPSASGGQVPAPSPSSFQSTYQAAEGSASAPAVAYNQAPFQDIYKVHQASPSGSASAPAVAYNQAPFQDIYKAHQASPSGSASAPAVAYYQAPFQDIYQAHQASSSAPVVAYQQAPQAPQPPQTPDVYHHAPQTSSSSRAFSYQAAAPLPSASAVPYRAVPQSPNARRVANFRQKYHRW